MDSLRAMFPDVDTQTLQATLEAHDNSVERTVDYLLSSAATTETDQARFLQVEQDAAIARRLQAEQDAVDTPTHAPNQPPTDNPLPSMADVQSAFKPIIDGVQYAGRVAAQSAQSLYREITGAGQPSSARTPFQETRDESVVLRGEAGSPAAARGTQRQRRPFSASYATGSTAGKKDA